MRRYRVVVRVGDRKLTRHVRAHGAADAARQACVVAGVGRPLSDVEREVLGAPPGARFGGDVVSIEEMGPVTRRARA